MLSEADFTAAMKEYENDSDTEEDGEEIDQSSLEFVFEVAYYLQPQAGPVLRKYICFLVLSPASIKDNIFLYLTMGNIKL